MNNIILSAADVSKTYIENKIETRVLKSVNLKICSNQVTAIIGKSGSGKSTLLHILGTLDSPSSGEIYFRDLCLTRLSPAKKARFRNEKLGFIYQFHHLLGDFSALENVMMPMLIAKKPIHECRERAEQYLKKVGLAHRMNFKPSELSGGERQRVAIARALSNQPELILADEPTGNLDAQNAGEVFRLFSELVHEEQIAVVMVTHDNSLAEQADRIYTMTDGVINAE